MKVPGILLFMSLVAAVFAVTAPAAGKSTAATVPAEEENGPPARPVIHLGMTPAEVSKVIGRPDEVESVATPAGEGTRWTYRRLEKKYTQETAATVDMVPSFVGEAMPNQGIGDAITPHNHLEHVKVYQVSSLLFVGGKLVAATQRPVKERQIEN